MPSPASLPHASIVPTTLEDIGVAVARMPKVETFQYTEVKAEAIQVEVPSGAFASAARAVEEGNSAGRKTRSREEVKRKRAIELKMIGCMTISYSSPLPPEAVP